MAMGMLWCGAWEADGKGQTTVFMYAVTLVMEFSCQRRMEGAGGTTADVDAVSRLARTVQGSVECR